MPGTSARRAKRTVITRADRALRAGKFELALRLYRRALDRNPRNPPIWVQCGHVLKEVGRLQEAETAYRRALFYEPQAADPYLHLGHALKLQGRGEEAQGAYMRALALDPSSAAPAHELAAFGWSDDQLAELKGFSGTALPEPALPEARAVSAATGQTDLDDGPASIARDHNPSGPSDASFDHVDPVWRRDNAARLDAVDRFARLLDEFVQRADHGTDIRSRAEALQTRFRHIFQAEGTPHRRGS